LRACISLSERRALFDVAEETKMKLNPSDF